MKLKKKRKILRKLEKKGLFLKKIGKCDILCLKTFNNQYNHINSYVNFIFEKHFKNCIRYFLETEFDLDCHFRKTKFKIINYYLAVYKGIIIQV